jgi:alginate O-acetyltransferase complex protein AlgI
MTFLSWSFVVFFIIVLACYFVLGSRWRWQNVLLLVASYVFYAFWDWRFLGLLLSLTAVNFAAGWAIGKQTRTDEQWNNKGLWLGLAIAFDLLVLAAFKYFNFFDENLVTLFSQFGVHLNPINLKLVLPLGISFYTFMSVTYPFDIYRGKMSATRSFRDFALFVAFFPTVVSGPVERAAHILPQFQSRRSITGATASEGLWLIAWGFFQKLVIADNAGIIVDKLFANPGHFQGLDIVIGVLAYAVQILADFGGYTDIARGVARLMGFELLLNFNVPYFAINPSDFWSRWHISLSQWFRDYLYISLGGNRKGKWRTSLNLIITMALVGLWHGAAWNFVIWGAWHGIMLAGYRLFGKAGQSTDRTLRGWLSALSVVSRTGLMFVLVIAGWAAFRSTSFQQLTYIYTHVSFGYSPATLISLWTLFYYSLPLIVVQIIQVRRSSPIVVKGLKPISLGLIYGAIFIGIVVFSPREISRFIYQGF